MTIKNTKFMLLALALFGLLTLIVLISGCSSPKALKGGKAKISTGSTNSLSAEISQSENPNAATKTDLQDNYEKSIMLPEDSEVWSYHICPTDTGELKTNITKVVLSKPALLIEKREKIAASNIGASQKDTTREITAKLSAMRPIQFIGIAFILGALSMFHPVVRTLTGGSTTLQWILGAAGIGLVFLPTIFVGNEKLIIILAIIPALWYVAYRHGSKSNLTK